MYKNGLSPYRFARFHPRQTSQSFVNNMLRCRVHIHDDARTFSLFTRVSVRSRCLPRMYIQIQSYTKDQITRGVIACQYNPVSDYHEKKNGLCADTNGARRRDVQSTRRGRGGAFFPRRVSSYTKLVLFLLQYCGIRDATVRLCARFRCCALATTAERIIII